MEAEDAASRASPAPAADTGESSSPSPAPQVNAFAPRPRWSHDEDANVTVVQSTHDYTQHVFQAKPPTAKWVRGLTEGEDDYPIAGFRRRTNMNKWEELEDGPDGVQANGSTYVASTPRPWLFYINLVGLLYVLLMALRVGSGLHKSYRLDFPATDRQLQMYGRRYGENGISFLMRVGVPLCSPHCIGAVYVALLSYRLGGAAHHFVGLWGVGLAAISLFAVFAQVSVLFGCCTVSSATRRWECELPRVFHVVVSVLRVLTPLLALWCVAPVVDKVRGCGWRWRCILALPCLAAFLCLGVSLHAGQLSEVLLDAAHGTVVLVVPLFIKACWRQPRFLLIPPRAEKPHED